MNIAFNKGKEAKNQMRAAVHQRPINFTDQPTMFTLLGRIAIPSGIAKSVATTKAVLKDRVAIFLVLGYRLPKPGSTPPLADCKIESKADIKTLYVLATKIPQSCSNPFPGDFTPAKFLKLTQVTKFYC